MRRPVKAVLLVWITATGVLMLSVALFQPPPRLDARVGLFVWAAMCLAPLATILSRKAFRRTRAARLARQQAPARNEAAQAWLADAEQMMSRLTWGDPPSPLTVWGVVLHPGEQAHLQLQLTYSRLYGHDVTYRRGSSLFIGSPGMVLAAAAGNMIGEAAAKSRARQAAETRWRDHQNSTVILTNRRVICQVDGQWASFHHSGVTALYPDLPNRSVVVEFADTVPLCLHGLAAPTAMVYLCWAIYGADKLREHPALQPLRGGKPWPLRQH
jgi:hypothetical protein